MTIMPLNEAMQKPVNLVTGASSDLGRMLAHKLISRGEEVRVLLSKHPSESDEWSVLPKGVRLYVADLTLKHDSDFEELKSACKGVNRIFHLAGAVYNYNNSYNKLVEVNVFGTENLLKAYLDANPSREARMHFIYSSSVTVYGYRRKGETLTEESELKPKSPYSQSKHMAENLISIYSEQNPRITYTILRLPTMYGSERYNIPIFKMFRMIKDNKFRMIGDGSNILPFINVEDATNAMLLAADNMISRNKIYNVTDGKDHELRKLIKIGADLMNKEMPKKRVSPLVARIGRRVSGINYDEYEFVTSNRIVSIEKAKKELHYKPSSNIEADAPELVKEFLEENGSNSNHNSAALKRSK
ncbi:MAG: NAD(P)-dependent oxidoreductase [Candidatus Marsarchaeota archaeon]|nr:NAD(P)-dependent oxidoreductase [Candidatus Marsarchaeota archaeon]